MSTIGAAMKQIKKSSPIWKAYVRQRINAQHRGIPFEFTFEQWTGWWNSKLGSNWFKKRGNKQRHYVMARHGDKGSYNQSNVKCITTLQNLREGRLGEKNPNAKIGRREVLLIREATGTQREIGLRFGVSQTHVYNIKSGKLWGHIA